jgi:hypothetical protein
MALKKAISPAALTFALLAGCAGGPDHPPPSLTAARSTIGAPTLQTASTDAPDAANRAHRKLEAAEAAWRNDDVEKAAWLADEAQVTAKLAEAQAAAAQADRAKTDVQKVLTALKQEAGPTGTAIGRKVTP